MWRDNRIAAGMTAVLLCLCCLGLTACGEEKKTGGEVLLYEGEEASGGAVSAGEEQYKTTTVEKGDYQEVYSDTAELEYTDKETIYIDEEDAVLDAIKVKKYDRVRKGDVLAVYHVETSETKLEKEKLLVSQARANYESGLSSLNGQLSQLETEYKLEKQAAEKKMKQLELKKLRKEIEAYKKGEKEVVDQEKEYRKLVNLQSKTNLVAKKSGVVTSVKREYVGEDIDSSKAIIEVRNNDKWVLKVKDPDGKLRYNMDVSVRLGKNMKDYSDEVKGKVITATDITGVDDMDESGEEVVFIDVSKADKENYDFENNNIYIYAVSFEIRNCLLVDNAAVYSESQDTSNKLYVMLLDNGGLHKRYIVSNYKTEEKYLVEQGVEENQTLAILE